MGHFSDESWFDYVRRLLPVDQMDFIKTHLEEGCRPCRELHHFWERAASIIARESDYEPDERDVRGVVAAFGSRRPSAMPTNWIPAYVIYDNLRDGPPLGFRSALIHVKHLLYEAGGWSVAIRLKSESGNQVSLTGHVTQRGVSGPVGGLRIKITSGDASMAETATNGLGEFYLQCHGRKHLQLHVRLSDQDGLRIDLPTPDG